MPSSISGVDIRREWGQLQRRAKPDPGVAYVGYRTGQLALHFDPPENGIQRVFLKAFATPGVGEDPMIYYHAVVHRTTDDGRRVQQREQFRHPVPAQDWLLETVPDFDLLDTVPINVPGGDAGNSESTAPDG